MTSSYETSPIAITPVRGVELDTPTGIPAIPSREVQVIPGVAEPHTTVPHDAFTGPLEYPHMDTPLFDGPTHHAHTRDEVLDGLIGNPNEDVTLPAFEATIQSNLPENRRIAESPLFNEMTAEIPHSDHAVFEVADTNIPTYQPPSELVYDDLRDKDEELSRRLVAVKHDGQFGDMMAEGITNIAWRNNEIRESDTPYSYTSGESYDDDLLPIRNKPKPTTLKPVQRLATRAIRDLPGVEPVQPTTGPLRVLEDWHATRPADKAPDTQEDVPTVTEPPYGGFEGPMRLAAKPAEQEPFGELIGAEPEAPRRFKRVKRAAFALSAVLAASLAFGASPATGPVSTEQGTVAAVSEQRAAQELTDITTYREVDKPLATTEADHTGSWGVARTALHAVGIENPTRRELNALKNSIDNPNNGERVWQEGERQSFDLADYLTAAKKLGDKGDRMAAQAVAAETQQKT